MNIPRDFVEDGDERIYRDKSDAGFNQTARQKTKRVMP
jgi:hypothetical protein